MNNRIKRELHKVLTANLPDFTDDTDTMIIPKMTQIILQPNHCYIIKVEDYIIHPYEGFTLHDDWNKGIVPEDKYMKCSIINFMGKMINIDAVGYNPDTDTDTGKIWSGWLPIKSITIIKEI